MSLDRIKADLLAQYGGVAPKMAEEAHVQVIDQVKFLQYNPFKFNLMFHFLFIHVVLEPDFDTYVGTYMTLIS